jgi:acyl-CoA synthetase (AMP-forming)/AMP-acid ligase II
MPRLQAIVRDARARFILSSQEIIRNSGEFLRSLSDCQIVELDAIPNAPSLQERFRPKPGQVALVQYTSGTTGTPRGVVITHANIMHNLYAGHRLDCEEAIAVIWLPPYHDFGLIGGVLLPVHSGRWIIQMSPLAFAQRPARWLQAISRYRGNSSAGPNFAYEFCIHKIRPEECEDLDLSCWTLAVTGAEPVRAETIDRFVERFVPYGFRREAFYPGFGMAESTLYVTGGHRDEPPVVRAFSRRALEKHRAEMVGPTAIDSRWLVGSGRPIPGAEVAIVDPVTLRLLGERRVGEIWIHSPSVGIGYFNSPEETERVFRARLAADNGKLYLRTGDLGFLCQRDLFHVGRLKELVTLGSRHFDPLDIELTIQRWHPALKVNAGAVFSVHFGGDPQLVFVNEILKPKRVNLDEVVSAIKAGLAKAFSLVPHAVVLISSGSLPKTSSGKTCRYKCRELFLQGRLSVLAEWRAEPVCKLGDSNAYGEDLATVAARVWRTDEHRF